MPKIKNIIIFLAITTVFFLIYVFFIKSSPEPAGLVSSEAGASLPNIDGSMTDTDISNTNSLITKDFLALFSNIKNIKLNDGIFSDPAFISLHDSSITLMPDGNEGRPNPFAQFGSDAVPPAQPVLLTPPAPTAPTSIRP